MNDIVERVGQLLEGLVTDYGYAGLAAAMFLENIFPPIPSELVMPGAGMLVARGDLHMPGVLIASLAGSLLGMLVLYAAGRRAGGPLVRAVIRHYGRWLWLREADYNRTLRLFGRYGGALLFSGQWVPAIRSLIALPAGMRCMPLNRFLFWVVLGLGMRNVLLGYTGTRRPAW